MTIFFSRSRSRIGWFFPMMELKNLLPILRNSAKRPIGKRKFLAAAIALRLLTIGTSLVGIRICMFSSKLGNVSRWIGSSEYALLGVLSLVAMSYDWKKCMGPTKKAERHGKLTSGPFGS